MMREETMMQQQAEEQTATTNQTSPEDSRSVASSVPTVVAKKPDEESDDKPEPKLSKVVTDARDFASRPHAESIKQSTVLDSPTKQSALFAVAAAPAPSPPSHLKQAPLLQHPPQPQITPTNADGKQQRRRLTSRNLSVSRATEESPSSERIQISSALAAKATTSPGQVLAAAGRRSTSPRRGRVAPSPAPESSSSPAAAPTASPSTASSATTGEVEVRDADVLCGRNKNSFNHAGNKKFRQAVTNSMAKYLEADSRYEKSTVVHYVIDDVRKRGGRFLKQNPTLQRWELLSDGAAKEKVGHAIRDAVNSAEARSQRNANQQPGMMGGKAVGRRRPSMGAVSGLYISPSLIQQHLQGRKLGGSLLRAGGIMAAVAQPPLHESFATLTGPSSAASASQQRQYRRASSGASSAAESPATSGLGSVTSARTMPEIGVFSMLQPPMQQLTLHEQQQLHLADPSVELLQRQALHGLQQQRRQLELMQMQRHQQSQQDDCSNTMMMHQSLPELGFNEHLNQPAAAAGAASQFHLQQLRWQQLQAASIEPQQQPAFDPLRPPKLHRSNSAPHVAQQQQQPVFLEGQPLLESEERSVPLYTGTIQPHGSQQFNQSESSLSSVTSGGTAPVFLQASPGSGAGGGVASSSISSTAGVWRQQQLAGPPVATASLHQNYSLFRNEQDRSPMHMDDLSTQPKQLMNVTSEPRPVLAFQRDSEEDEDMASSQHGRSVGPVGQASRLPPGDISAPIQQQQNPSHDIFGIPPSTHPRCIDSNFMAEIDSALEPLPADALLDPNMFWSTTDFHAAGAYLQSNAKVPPAGEPDDPFTYRPVNPNDARPRSNNVDASSEGERHCTRPTPSMRVQAQANQAERTSTPMDVEGGPPLAK